MKNNTFVQFLKKKASSEINISHIQSKKNFITDIFAYEY